jgi:hypothetical protein
MQNISPREDLVLVSSRKVLEAADLADFAKSRSLGEVIVESDTDRARVLLRENHFSFAFIGLPDTEERGSLLTALSAENTRVVLVDDSGSAAGAPGLRVLSRPYTDVDLEGAISAPENRADIREPLGPTAA